MMQMQQRVALGDVTSQINNRANRFSVDGDSKKAFVDAGFLKEKRVKNAKENDLFSGHDDDLVVARAQKLREQTLVSSVSTESIRSQQLSSNSNETVQHHLIEVEADDEDDAETDSEALAFKEDEEAETGGDISEEMEDVDESFTPLVPVVTEHSERLYQYVYERLHREEPDPNDEDTWDPVMVSEYTIEIFEHLKFLERKFSPNPRYIEHQPELTWKYRSTLIDWIVQVHDRFQLLPETLFLTVNIIDRFLSKKQVTLNRLQLVGAAALFIASKYEEINCPTLKDMLYMLDNAYTREEILRAERFMINTLNFEFGWPGPMSFLRRVSKADDYEYDTRTVAKYLLETSIMEPEIIAAPPSWLAAGAYYLSKIIIGLTGWSDEHIYYSGYTEEQLIPLATMILDSCRHATERHKAIFDKYSRSRHRKSAFVVAKWISMAESQLEQK